MDPRVLLIPTACLLVFSLCEGVAGGEPQIRCPPRHCPPPEPCPFVEPTYYLYNDSGLQILCRGCDRCQTSPHISPERRELNREKQCEDILCAPVESDCKVTATREPAQLVGSDGSPCAACPVCLDYIANLPPGI